MGTFSCPQKGDSEASRPHNSEKSPLDMNCEDALSFIADRLQHNVMQDLALLPNSQFLDRIAEMMLTPSLTECIGIAFYPMLPDLVGRWAQFGHEACESMACGLGRLVYVQPRLKRYDFRLSL